MKENYSILETKRMEIAENALEAKVLFEKILTGKKGPDSEILAGLGKKVCEMMIKKCEEFEILLDEAEKVLKN